jgi:hypothetical protein
MLENIAVVAMALLAGGMMLLRSAMSGFEGDDEDTEHSAATGGQAAGGDNENRNVSKSLTNNRTRNQGTTGAQLQSRGPLDNPQTQGRGRQTKIQKTTSCKHCGAANKEDSSRCWSCGSSPQANFSSDRIDSINKRLQQAAADESFLVREGEEPNDEPVTAPAIPAQQQEDEEDAFEQPDKRKEDIPDDDIPLYRKKIGQLLGFIDKWKTLTGTHMRSMTVVAGITCVFWGISIIYGMVQFGPTGLVALVSASAIAVMTAAVATLFYHAPGRIKTVSLAYPFVFNTIFLPATAIALYEPALDGLLAQNIQIAEFIASSILGPLGVEMFFRTTFDLNGGAHLLMWFAISFPIGWTIGLVVVGVEEVRNRIEALSHRFRAMDEDQEDAQDADGPPAGSD